jgi:hypothetical protein
MNIIEKDLFRQLALIMYDRNKILSEQITPKDPFGREDNILTQTMSKITASDLDENNKRIYFEDKKVAKDAFEKIAKEIDGGWLPWNWGTDEDGITDAILSIQNKQQYEILKQFLSKKYTEFLLAGYTVLGFIQAQEFTEAMKPEVRKIWLDFANLPPESKVNPITLAQLHQYLANDKYLIRMENHLKKFDKKEKFSTTKLTALNLFIPPQVSGVVHTILPIASFLLMAFPPAALAVELLDAGLYAAEGDAYGAGLAIVFCCIPGGPAFQWFRGYEKAELNLIIKKFSQEAETQIPAEWTERELQLIKKLSQSQIQRLIKINAWKKSFIYLLDEIHSTGYYLKVIWWLVKKGVIPARFLTEFGLQIGGAFFTWDFIASKMGICDNTNLRSLEQATQPYLKVIGSAANKIQRFTNPCDKRQVLNNFKNLVETTKPTSKENIIDSLKIIIKDNAIFDQTSFENTETLQVLMIQIALKNLGITHFEKIGMYSEPNKKPTINIKTNTGAGKYNDYDPSGGIGSARLKTPGLVATGNINIDKEKSLKKELKTEKIEINYKWGYYNTNMTEAVKLFQKKYNLTTDGKVGPKTAEVLISKIKGLNNISDFGQSKIRNLTPKKIEELLQNAIDVFTKQQGSWEESYVNYEPTPEQNEQTAKNVENNAIKDLSEKPFELIQIKDDIYSDSLKNEKYPK